MRSCVDGAQSMANTDHKVPGICRANRMFCHFGLNCVYWRIISTAFCVAILRSSTISLSLSSGHSLIPAYFTPSERNA